MAYWLKTNYESPIAIKNYNTQAQAQNKQELDFITCHGGLKSMEKVVVILFGSRGDGVDIWA